MTSSFPPPLFDSYTAPTGCLTAQVTILRLAENAKFKAWKDFTQSQALQQTAPEPSLGQVQATAITAAEVNFEKIPLTAVRHDIDTNTRRKHFNTAFHTADEAPGFERPSEAPYLFKRWLPVILESRGPPSSALQVVRLTVSLTLLLVQACDASIPEGSINLLLAEDVGDVIGPAFSRLVFPVEGLVMRLDTCSPKDCAQTAPGQVAVRSVKEAVLRLVTSLRCQNALVKGLETIEEGTDGGINGTAVEVYFLIFKEDEKREGVPGLVPTGRRGHHGHQPVPLAQGVDFQRPI